MVKFHIKVGLAALLAVLLFAPGCWAVTSNADGTRNYRIPTDFADKDNSVWGHPAGVMPGDKINGVKAKFNVATGTHKAIFVDDDDDIIRKFSA
mgnify:CR=1 FL=1